MGLQLHALPREGPAAVEASDEAAAEECCCHLPDVDFVAAEPKKERKCKKSGIFRKIRLQSRNRNINELSFCDMVLGFRNCG